MAQNISKEKAEELQKFFSELVNTINDTDTIEEFCKLMANDHRTLQQSFTRLALRWIETAGHPDYRFDLRNQASHETCRSIVDKWLAENTGVPSRYISYI